MPADPLATICIALAVGLAAFLIAGRLRVPAIVFLLLFGMLAGPSVLGWVKPEQLGDATMRSLVLGAVLAILFEGSLSLRVDAFRLHGGPITRLVTLGALVTWVGASVATHWIIGAPWRVSIVIGAVLIVTGPTVVIPLLRAIRPNAKVSEVLRWEGILIDPIGALAAIVTFEFVLAGEAASFGQAIASYARAGAIGIGFGAVAGFLVDRGLRWRDLVPHELTTPFSLGVVLLFSMFAEGFAHESSLFAAPVAGVVLAALSPPRLHEIERFNGEVTTLFLAVLFSLLAATVHPREIARLGWSALALLVALQVVRVLAVTISTVRSDLTWKERIFLGWLAPRGIVAASVASIFGSDLATRGVEGAEQIVPVTFLVILGTVVIQGMLARRIGAWLGVLAPPARNVVIAGATPFGVELALALEEAGVEAVIVDRSQPKVAWAEERGAVAYEGDVLSPATYADIDLEATGAYLAATSSDKVNGLAAELAREIIGERAVMQVPAGEEAFGLVQEKSATMRSPLAFGERFTLRALNDALVSAGARLVVRDLERPTSAVALRAREQTDFRPLVVIDRREGRPGFVRERGARLPAGKVVGIENLPPELLSDDQQHDAA